MDSISKTTKGELQIVLGTSLFGISFVLGRAAMSMGIGAHVYNAAFHIVSAVAMTIALSSLKKLTSATSAPIMDAVQVDREITQDHKVTAFIDSIKLWFPDCVASSNNFELLFWAFLCGLTNCLASTCTQIGLQSISAGKSAFITGLYVVMTPMIQYLVPLSETNSLTKYTWLAALLSLCGSTLLAIQCDSTLASFADTYYGELITFCGAVVWATSIICSDFGAKRVDCIHLAVCAMSISSCFCLTASVLIELDQWFSQVLWSHMGAIIVLSVGVLNSLAYALDTLGQIHTPPSRAALLMSLDSVVALLTGYLYLNESLTILDLTGCALIFFATVLASVDSHVDDGALPNMGGASLVVATRQFRTYSNLSEQGRPRSYGSFKPLLF